MKRLLKFFLFLAIGLAVFLIVMQMVGLENIERAFSFFWGIEGLIIFLLAAFFVLLGILKWQLILKSMGYGFSFKELGPLWLIGFTISYLTPFAVFGGEVFRIYFTKKQFPDLQDKENMASVAIDKITDATVFFLFLIAGLLTFTLYGNFPRSLSGAAVALTAGLLLGLLLFFYLKRLQKQSAIEWLCRRVGFKKEQISNGALGNAVFEAEKQVFHFFSLKNKGLWKAFAITVLRYGIHLGQVVLLIFFLTSHFSILKSLAGYGFVNLAVLTPFPATLGALELGEGFVFSSLGFGFHLGTIFSMVLRGANLILCFFGSLFLIKQTISLIKAKFHRFFNY